MEDGKCRIVGKRRVLEAATCLLLPGTPVILATTVVDRKAGFVNYPFHENTCNKAYPWPRTSIHIGRYPFGKQLF
jgi:hypothetical protein